MMPILTGKRLYKVMEQVLLRAQTAVKGARSLSVDAGVTTCSDRSGVAQNEAAAHSTSRPTTTAAHLTEG